MSVLGRLRLLVERAPAESLPAEVLAVLINDLYAPLLSFVIGATTATFVTALAAIRTGNLWLTGLALATASIAATRVLATSLYRYNRRSITDDTAALRRWEARFALGGVSYGACIGLTCFIAFVFSDDPISQLLLMSNAIGYTAGVTARNSGRPRIAIAQLSAILWPIIAGTALHQAIPYFVLSAITFLYLLATVELTRYLGGNRLGLLMALREKEKLAQSFAQQNIWFNAALANMSHGLCMYDADLRLMVWNQKFCEIYGLSPEALSTGLSAKAVIELSAARGNYPNQVISDLIAEFEDRVRAGIPSYWKRHLPSDRTIAVSLQPTADKGAVVIFEDVTTRERAEDRARFLSTHDELTGLPNRLMFAETVSDAVKLARSRQQQFAVMFIDLDRFKMINDTLGHSAGDRLLIETAKRLKKCIDGGDLVARLGGDEFVVLLRGICNTEQVSRVARKMLSAVMVPFQIERLEYLVTASIGISVFPSDAQDEDSLIRNADVAMYTVKETGRNNFSFYSRDVKSRLIERLMLQNSLRHALERNELVLFYQPKLDVKRNIVSGAEALLRWNHPDLGLLQPGDFISVAEETGLIVSIGQWVLKTACTQNVAWQSQGLRPIRLAVNLSPRQFTDPNLLQDIRAALEESGMEPELLEVEITETMVMQNVEHAVRVLEAIKRIGVTLAMDDFGTGYSSMSMVNKFPIDTLKIDRSFVRDVTADDDAGAIAEAIIALGHALDLTVVAEGVESADQEAFLRARNCDEIQGFLISEPLPAERFAEFLAKHNLVTLKHLSAKARLRAGVRQTGTKG